MATTEPYAETEKKILEKLGYAKLSLSYTNPSLSAVILRYQHLAIPKTIMEDPDRPIAYTNGRECYYGPEIIDMTPQEAVGVMVHESLHIILGHVRRFQTITEMKNRKIANIAADFLINTMIQQVAVQKPRLIALPTKKFKLVMASEITNHDFPFKTLARYHKESGLTEDDFILKYDLLDLYRVLMKDAPKEDEDDASGFEKNQDIRPDSKTPTPGEMSQAEADERQIARQLAASAGSDPTNMIRRIVDQMNIRGIDFRRLFTGLIGRSIGSRDEQSWTRRNRRLSAHDIPAAGTKKLPRPFVGIVCDTSGSMGEKEISTFASLLGLAARTSDFDCVLVSADCVVTKVEVFESDTLLQKIKSLSLNGGGGTSFGPALRYLDKLPTRPSMILYFTDLIGSTDYKPKAQTLWITTEAFRHVAHPFGRKIVITAH